MKKGRLFPKIIYYIFTFLLGIFLALTLPPYFYNFSKLPNFIETSLESGDYYSAMLVTANYFNKKPVFSEQFENGGGIVLFESVMPAEAPAEDDENALQEGLLYKTFWGFVYGTGKDYETYKQGDNQTRLVIQEGLTGRGFSKTVPLLDFDIDDDGKNDGIATHKNYGFIVLNLSEDLFSQLIGNLFKLELYDCNGETFWTGLPTLDFESDYFNRFDGFIEEYNRLVKRIAVADTDSELKSLNAEIEELYLSFREEYTANADNVVVDYLNTEYQQVQKEVNRSANVTASIIVVAYFIGIYIIADFLLGSHYIIKFFRWFLYKVCKLTPRNPEKVKKEEVFGHDYYSSVTVSLDLEEVPEFNESVQIKYTNSDVEIVFILLKENNYTATERIKAGTYVNPFIDMNRNYASTNLPENLVVEGYKMDVKIKIIKREV